MKKPLFLFFILLCSLGVNAKDTVIILVTSQEAFYFQVGKLMKGGQLEIYDPAGKLIIAQQITVRKLIVELPDLSPGEYIMKVVKHSKDQRFDYLEGNGAATVTMRDEITVTLKLEPKSSIPVNPSAK